MEQRYAGRFVVDEGEDRLELRLRAEAVMAQIGFGRDHRLGRPLERANSRISRSSSPQSSAVAKRTVTRRSSFAPFAGAAAGRTEIARRDAGMKPGDKAVDAVDRQ